MATCLDLGLPHLCCEAAHNSRLCALTTSRSCRSLPASPPGKPQTVQPLSPQKHRDAIHPLLRAAPSDVLTKLLPVQDPSPDRRRVPSCQFLAPPRQKTG